MCVCAGKVTLIQTMPSFREMNEALFATHYIFKSLNSKSALLLKVKQMLQYDWEVSISHLYSPDLEYLDHSFQSLEELIPWMSEKQKHTFINSLLRMVNAVL